MSDRTPFDSSPTPEWQDQPLSRKQFLVSELIRLGLRHSLLLKFDEPALEKIREVILDRTITLTPDMEAETWVKQVAELIIDIEVTAAGDVKFHLADEKGPKSL